MFQTRLFTAEGEPGFQKTQEEDCSNEAEKAEQDCPAGGRHGHLVAASNSLKQKRLEIKLYVIFFTDPMYQGLFYKHFCNLLIYSFIT